MKEARITQPDIREICSYIGLRGSEPDAVLRAQIEECLEKAVAVSRPAAVYSFFGLEREPGGIRLSGTETVLTGSDIGAHLEGCARAVLMAATIGSDPEKYLIRTGCETVADAMILDACFSACAENVCDNLEEDIREELAEKGLYLTGRFSPGYGDLPLGLQREILDVLNAGRRIGLTLSESGLMIPRKSVTAVLGVSETPRRGKRAGCEACAMSGNCSYQKEGVTCG